MKKIRLGLVGCGGMMAGHVQASYLVENAEVTALCDLVLENAQRAAEGLENAYVTTDFRTMLDYVDAVLIALPHDLHFECGMFFATNGKHVMMEKPLCNSEEECVTLIEACDANNVKLMCAYPVRYWDGIVKLKELVDSGDFGQVIQMSVWTEQLTGGPVDWSNPRKLWGRTARLGGGQFFSHGCHYVDLLLWFLGNPVKGIHIGTRVGTPWILKEGTSAATILFENGAIGYHGATWGARGTRMGYDFQVMTEKGLLDYDHYDGTIKLFDGSEGHVPGKVGVQKCKVLWERQEDVTKETQHEIRHFADCILNDKTPLTDGRSALQGLRVIWALYDAEKHNTMADLRGLGLGEG